MDEYFLVMHFTFSHPKKEKEKILTLLFALKCNPSKIPSLMDMILVFNMGKLF